MADRQDIYVNLNETEINEGDPQVDIDSNGAIILDNILGSDSAPLSYKQFRTYLRYRLLDNQAVTFYIKGVADEYIENVDSSLYTFLDIRARDPLFSDTHKVVKFRPWPGEESYTFKINIDASENNINIIDNKSAVVYLRNTTLDIEGMKVQPLKIKKDTTEYDLGSLVFENIGIPREIPTPTGTIEVAPPDSNVIINNSIIFTNGDGTYDTIFHQAAAYSTSFNRWFHDKIPMALSDLSIAFIGIKHISLLNNTIISRNNGNIFISDDFYVRLSTVLVSYNNIFLNQNLIRRYDPWAQKYFWFYSSNNVYSIDINTMSILPDNLNTQYLESLSIVDIGEPHDNNRIYGSQGNDSKNDFNIPTTLTLNSDNIDDWGDTELEYTKNGWEIFGVRGAKVLDLPNTSSVTSIFRTIGSRDGFAPYPSESFFNHIQEIYDNQENSQYLYKSFGRRDGIGALYFPELPAPNITASETDTVINTTVTFETTDLNYDDYSPQKYEWGATTRLPIIDYYTTDSNEWEYTFDEDGFYNVFLKTTAYNGWYIKTSGIVIRVFGGEEKTIPLTLYKIPFNSNEPELVVNNEITVFDSLMISATDINIENNENIFLEQSGVFWDFENRDNNRFITQYSGGGGGEYYSPVYTSVGDYNVVFAARYNDKMSYYKTFPITVVDNVQDILYVDLLESYSKFKGVSFYNYFLIDNFNSGLIREEWNNSFKTEYDVKEMWGENVAYGTEEVILLDHIGTEDFNIEFSFVRTVANDVPKFIFKSQNGSEEYTLNISWSFINDRIILDDSINNTFITYDSRNKDLLCPDAVRKLSFVITNEGNPNQLIIKYKINDETNWDNSNIFNIDVSNSIQLSTECSNNVGLGYLSVKTQSITDTNNMNENGSEEYPLSFEEFYNKAKQGGEEGLGEANINSKFLLRNYRVINSGEFNIANSMFYEIDAWDNSKYGPWVLKFGDDFNNPIKFAGVQLSNGIIFNTTDQKTKLNISFLYNMFIVWNSQNIELVRSKWKYSSSDKRTDIKGSTLYNADKYSTKMIETDL